MAGYNLDLGNGFILDFSRYADPAGALNVLKAYITEPLGPDGQPARLKLGFDMLRKIEAAVCEHTDALDLDIALDAVFSPSNLPYPRPRFGGNGNYIEDEDDGYYNVARKYMEENTCHDALLVTDVIYRDELA